MHLRYTYFTEHFFAKINSSKKIWYIWKLDKIKFNIEMISIHLLYRQIWRTGARRVATYPISPEEIENIYIFIMLVCLYVLRWDVRDATIDIRKPITGEYTPRRRHVSHHQATLSWWEITFSYIYKYTRTAINMLENLAPNPERLILNFCAIFMCNRICGRRFNTNVVV